MQNISPHSYLFILPKQVNYIIKCDLCENKRCVKYLNLYYYAHIEMI